MVSTKRISKHSYLNNIGGNWLANLCWKSYLHCLKIFVTDIGCVDSHIDETQLIKVKLQIVIIINGELIHMLIHEAKTFFPF